MPDAALRLGIFAAVFVLLACAEGLWPRREQPLPRRQRWPGHLALQMLSVLLLRVIFPGAAIGLAMQVEALGWGLFNFWSVADVAAVALSLLLLDLGIYGQHVASHRWPWLWRLHRLHHSDRQLDLTSALRFHPLEILLSMAWKGVLITVIGAPVLAVVIFEVVLNASALFNHANLRLPLGLDAGLRKFLVTPDMHRVHHSRREHETDSNYGFCLPWWDWLFGSYRAQPEAGHDGMQIGLQEFGAVSESRLRQMLTQPFREKQ
ncbi:MAG: sterol desaturase family protein [Pseudomonadota bacterium]